jgi:hypothetical protein
MSEGRIPNAKASASSVLNGDNDKYGPTNLALFNTYAWRPNQNSQAEWIMVEPKI